MSQYLVIKKNGVEIGSWSRSTEFYAAHNLHAPYEQEAEFHPEVEFTLILDNLKDEVDKYQDLIDTHEMILAKGKLSYEEVYSTIATIKELQKSIEDLQYYIAVTTFLRYHCYDEYADPEDIWTWYIA